MPSKLLEKRAEMEAKHKLLAEIFEEARVEGSNGYDFSKITKLEGDTEAKVAKVREINRELEVLGPEVLALEMAEVAERNKQREKDLKTPVPLPPGPRQDGDERPTLGDLFTKSAGYKRFLERKTKESFAVAIGDELELKTLFQTTAGWAPRPPRIDRVIGIAERPVQVLDLIPSIAFDQASVIYMEETTATHAGVELAEAGTYPESTYVYTERTSTVRKIADSLPVTDEQLLDIPQVRSYLDQRLAFGIRQRLDLQVIMGNGTPPNLTGVNAASGLQTQARSTDPHFDCVMKSIVLSRITGRANPNAIILHPTDWQTIKLTRTADGIYILGNPSEPGPNTLWGLPVALFDGSTAGTGWLGDFANYCQLYERKGIEVQVGFTGTQFTEGKVTLRVDTRVGFVVYRGAAFVKMTGL